MIQKNGTEYEVVIGLEIHAELSTKSKMYCSCTTEFGGEVNTHCCPICTGMPGILPVLNRKAVEYTIKAGLAMNCSISAFSKQDRKNYFYPDLPKAYQISQYDLPLCKGGSVEIDTVDGIKKVGITRIHIEEDAGKLMHDKWGTGSLVDFNRCGVPLMEIVSEPDMRSAEEARAFLETVKSILEYIDISDCKMQEGSLRADVNLSVRPAGQERFGTRTEMKNLNSLRSVFRAAESEARRQVDIIESGGKIVQETRRWDDEKGLSFSMRSKEEAHDYRYFPEPDIAPVVVSDEWISRIRSDLPELPDTKRRRYISEYDLPAYDAFILTSSRALSSYFEEAAKNSGNPKAVGNWLMGDTMRLLKERGDGPESIPFPPRYLTELVDMIEKGAITGTMAKKIFEIMFNSGKKPQDIAQEQDMQVLNKESELIPILQRIVVENPQTLADYKGGKSKAFSFFIGQVMKESKGKADPQVVSRLLKDILDN